VDHRFSWNNKETTLAWTTNPYCDLQDVKTAMNVTNTTDDAWITELIGEAQADIDRELSYSFQQNGPGVSNIYDGNDSDILWIEDCLAITQVLETVYNPYIGANGAFTLGNPQSIDITADVIMQPNNKTPQYLLARLSGLPFQFGRQNYKITGTWGQPNIPLPIQRACKLLVIHYFKRRDASYGQMTAGKQYGNKMQYPVDIPEEVCSILDKYKPRLFLSRNR
jgi:hypothetical protein